MISLMLSLNDVDQLYIEGKVSMEEIEEYLEKWNEGPHITKAVIRDGKIRNYLIE